MDANASQAGSPANSTSFLWLAALIPTFLGLHFAVQPKSGPEKGGLGWTFVVGLVATLSLLWVRVASRYVPEPYLDEIFHIPQAQRYGLGKWYEWDDKLTTPPGLYLFSLFICLISGAKGKLSALTPHDLRTTNAIALILLGYLSLLCRHELEHLLGPNTNRPAASRKGVSCYSLHTALNICLFPLLFFFSGLYYTDVASTAAVLASFLNHLRRVGKISAGEKTSLSSDLATLGLGVGTLFMRQTNVFWTVVFMGGLEAVQAVKSLKPELAREEQQSEGTLLEDIKLFLWRSSVGEVHDVPLSQAWVEDWLSTAISLLVAGLFNPFRVLRAIWPYIAVLASFAGFVVWNGGVVLGDKTNHVATIHLAQMLYIWPFFAFFSAPLFLPYLISLLDNLWAMAGSKTTSKEVAYEGSCQSRSKFLAGVYLLGTILLSLAIVHFNTIIHPFTLADNRHYMFYVFRYTIRRATWVRFALVVAYTISRWLVWGVFSGSTNETPPPVNSKHKKPTATLSEGETTTVTTSTATIFLLATTLSLITAPLVEPRYFIIPWVIWRLLIPAWHLPAGANGGMIQAAKQSSNSVVGTLVRYARLRDPRLGLETLWFILVNLVTIGIFLLKPYQWRAEDGTVLDEGRLQRFMW